MKYEIKGFGQIELVYLEKGYRDQGLYLDLNLTKLCFNLYYKEPISFDGVGDGNFAIQVDGDGGAAAWGLPSTATEEMKKCIPSDVLKLIGWLNGQSIEESVPLLGTESGELYVEILRSDEIRDAEKFTKSLAGKLERYWQKISP